MSSSLSIFDLSFFSNPNRKNQRSPNLVATIVLAPELFQRLRDDLPIVDLVTPSPSASSSSKPKTELIDKFKTRTADENPCGELK